MQIEFTIPGRIGGKGRPKFAVVRGFARAYTPASTRNAEAMIRGLAFDAMGGIPPMEGPVSLSLTIWLQRPQSWSKARKACTTFVTGKPDIDNIVKLVSDAMNGVTYRDDAQIARLSCDRFYTEGTERVLVRVQSLQTETVKRCVAALPLLEQAAAQ
jgi:Holliday junction resolvase RusA-like endonuclease